MKLYNKLGIFAAGALMMSSCAVNDLFDDKGDLGEVVPTVTWELSSSVCAAGNEAGFLAKYYTTEEGVSIDHSEVWAMVTRTESAAATQKLVSSPAYTKTVSLVDTVRGFHLLQSYPHSMAKLDTIKGTEYHLNASFPTSRTLGPVNWANPADWDDEKFAMYYPASFKEEFTSKIVNDLTKDSTYFASLRNVYIAYDFTKEQFEAVNAKYPTLEPLPWSDSQEAGSTKGDLWFGADTEVVDHYYYTTLVGEVTVEHEVATVEEAVAQGIAAEKVYPVYKAPHWVFCRYSDDTGAAVTSVRAEYMPLWKELIQMIPFEAWIYNSADACYSVEFSRKYAYITQFKVVDTKGGVGRDSDDKTVELN
ncbi:MAG: hypothetical protein E7080_06795 [Bacteroidales bacterium]|nr:hypothetical protein [Bacteroidales bacterium]